MSINITNPGVAGITVESDPTALKLVGGTLSGELNTPELGNLLNANLVIDSYNDTGAGTHYYHTFTPFDGKFNLAPNGGGLTFPNATVQTTAGLPLTGGTLSGKVNLAPLSGVSASLNLGIGTVPTSTFAGDIWVGTNLNFKDNVGTAKVLANTNTSNTFLNNQIVSCTSTLAGLRITQLGTGNAIEIEDSTSPDSSPFVVKGDGSVCIGTTTQVGNTKLTVSQVNGINIGGENIKDYTRREGDIQHLSRILAGSVSSWSYDSALDLSTFNLGGEMVHTLASQHWNLISIHADSGVASGGLGAISYNGGELEFEGDVSDSAANPNVWFGVDNYGFYVTFNL